MREPHQGTHQLLSLCSLTVNPNPVSTCFSALTIVTLDVSPYTLVIYYHKFKNIFLILSKPQSHCCSFPSSVPKPLREWFKGNWECDDWAWCGNERWASTWRPTGWEVRVTVAAGLQPWTGGDWTSLRHNEASVMCNADIKVWSKRIEMKHKFEGQTGKDCNVYTSTLNVSRRVDKKHSEWAKSLV